MTYEVFQFDLWRIAKASPGEFNDPNCVIDIDDDEIPVGEFILVILVSKSCGAMLFPSVDIALFKDEEQLILQIEKLTLIAAGPK